MMGRRKNIVGLFLKKFKIVFLIILLAFLGGFFWWQWVSSPVAPEEKSAKTFLIKKGEALDSIAQRLGQEELIRSPWAFKIIIFTKKISSSIQAGSFRLSPSLTTQELALSLTHGTIDVWLTFPEGWRKEEIARRLEANLDNFSSEKFLDLTTGLEGYLFPDTYLIPKSASPEEVVKIFQNNFENKAKPLLEEKPHPNLSQNEVLTLASLVEREARSEEDRKAVAGILLKRLQNQWPLQVDATIQYFKGSEDDWWPEVDKKDLAFDSPFNTYKYLGLPPAPICNPGLSALRAVLEPKETDFWFYLSDKQEKIRFAQTTEEQQENIANYLH
jgi:UPF0755 protein